VPSFAAPPFASRDALEKRVSSPPLLCDRDPTKRIKRSLYVFGTKQSVFRKPAEKVKRLRIANPDCGCLYVGTQQAFEQYASNQQLDIENAERQAIQNFFDPTGIMRRVLPSHS
jgi:hypothetical protein